MWANFNQIGKAPLSGCKSFEIKNLAASLLSLELIAVQQGVLTKSKRANILLKIRKGNPVGCTVVLRKNKMYNLKSEIFRKFKIQGNFPEIS